MSLTRMIVKGGLALMAYGHAVAAQGSGDKMEAGAAALAGYAAWKL